MPILSFSAPLRRWLAALALAVGCIASIHVASAQDSSERIAAIVNDDVITTQDLRERLGLVLATTGVPNDPEMQQRLQQQVLRGYIDEKLQLQEAKRLKLDVTDAEVDKAMESIANRNHMDLAAFRQALAERKIDVGVLRAQIRGQIAWAKVVNKELRPRVAVTQDQVNLALKEASTGREDTEIALSEILLPVDSPDQEPQVLRDAAGLVATLRAGGDFAQLARQVSVAASAEQGGDVGWVRPSMVLPELRAKLAAVPTGGVSDPIATPSGVHIFKVRERRTPGQPEPVKRLIVTKVSLAQVIVPLAPGAKEAQVKSAEKKARELAPRLKSCPDIEAYAKKSGSEGSGALGWLDVKDLPQVLQQLVAQLEPNRLSPPFRGPLGVQLLMVCDRQGREEQVAAPAAPTPPPPTSESMRQRLEDEQLQRLATRYLRELRKDAFIDVRMGA